jgi:hypothetical protein
VFSEWIPETIENECVECLDEQNMGFDEIINYLLENKKKKCIEGTRRKMLSEKSTCMIFEKLSDAYFEIIYTVT